MRVSPDTATSANRLGARKRAESRTSFLLMRRVRGRLASAFLFGGIRGVVPPG
jgi:hypothetical protein